jgi:imidazolonepropionase
MSLAEGGDHGKGSPRRGPGSGAIVCPTLVTVASDASGPLRGDRLRNVQSVQDGALLWENGTITYAGPAAGTDVPSGATPVGGAVLPGFVDCHTHLPFVGWRPEEFEARLAGRSYRDLHGGGGIYRSARLLAEATDDEALEFCRPLLAEMLAHGTTALEFKTGYGLSVEAELRQARLARTLAAEIPQTVSVTLLACHAIPAGRTAEQWVRAVCSDLIPAVAAEQLADAVDVYVEDIAFTVEQFRAVAATTHELGLAVRCHADQLGPSGAAEAAVWAGARGADHLNHLSAGGVMALGRSDTAAVLLPASTFLLRAQRPPVAELLAANAVLALGTDFNPGTSPCLSMPEAISVAAALYGLPPATAVAAATRNAASVLGLDGRLGSLEPGKRADFVVLDAPDPAMIPYRPGHNPIAQTWIEGRQVR